MAPTIHKDPYEAGAQITRDNYHWAGGIPTPPSISYGFRATAPGYDSPLHPVQSTFSEMTTTQMAAVDLAMNLWADVARISLVRIPSAPTIGWTDGATMLFGNYASGVDKDGKALDGAAAFAVFPGTENSTNSGNYAASSMDGDVWVNLSGTDNAANTNPFVGSRAFMALLHEIGHALGLEHPGDYNAGYNTTITYANDAEYIEDSQQYTLMSYFNASETGADHTYNVFTRPFPTPVTEFAAAPLLDDITAIQHLYGANFTTRVGDTTYGFNSNADRTSFNITSSGDQVVFAIWDAGGNDTLDVSGYGPFTNQVIDLHPGAFSDIGELTKNVAMALGPIETRIENAIGGSGNDRLLGNDVDNRLEGRDGADILFGDSALDTLIGGIGNDTYVLTDVTYRLFHGSILSFYDTVYDRVVEGAGEGIDTVRVTRSSSEGHELTSYTLTANVENGVVIGSGDFDLTGNGENNRLDGNEYANRLSGLAGADILAGGLGIDTLIGGAGDDLYVLTDTNRQLVHGPVFDFYDNLYDTVIEQPDQGIDTVQVQRTADRSGYTLGNSIENGIVLGVDNFDLTGNGADNTLIGNVGANVLDGGAGQDVLWGGFGSDVLKGGAGNDTLLGGNDVDTAVFSADFTAHNIAWTGSSITLSSSVDGVDSAIGIERFQFSDGTVVQNDGNVLVDDLFYYSRNPDVWAAGMDAEAHFAAFGWKDGRDPDAFFSTAGYLGANGDVKAANVNPLEHYHAFGWKEGRDPSAAFDTELYLRFNPDVAAAGVDPLEHFVQFGREEGRSAYEAVGRNLNGDFDATFYQLANPDVSAAGADPLSHFDMFGWHEGRDPNAFFDTSAYLSTYGDVAAAGMNPLAHYHQYGWKEGRDPSAEFDTDAYLAAYGDVKAAGIDPLEHFLKYGIYEGRSAFGDGVIA